MEAMVEFLQASVFVQVFSVGETSPNGIEHQSRALSTVEGLTRPTSSTAGVGDQIDPEPSNAEA